MELAQDVLEAIMAEAAHASYECLGRCDPAICCEPDGRRTVQRREITLNLHQDVTRWNLRTPLGDDELGIGGTAKRKIDQGTLLGLP